MATAGEVLQDRYELRSLIATGGMGEVWRAQDRVLGREVAVKVLKTQFTGDPVFLTRFRTEARLSAGLSHPNIAVLHDYGEAAASGGDRLVYLVMELVDGEPLSALLARAGPLTPARTLELLGQVAAGLAAAHAAGVVHRDVKPANLLVRPDGTVKMTDFGIAWSAANATVTRTGHVVGTPQYLAPELVQGQKATPAADVYSWGTVAYECLAGCRPFDGPDPVEVAMRRLTETPAALSADVPAPVRALVEHALAADPSARIPDGGALVAAVADAGAGRAPERPDERTATRVLPVAPAASSATTPLPAGPAQPAVHPAPPAVHPVPPADGSGGNGGGRLRRLAVPVLVGLVATALAGTGLVLGSRDVPAAPPPAAAATTPPPAPAPTTVGARSPDTYVRVVAEEHVGQPVVAVQAWLTGLDLPVRLVAVERADVPAGVVLALAPTGDLPVGTPVTVTHAVSPPAPPPPAPGPAPAATAPPAPSPSSAGEAGPGDGDRGRGEGRGRDRTDD